MKYVLPCSHCGAEHEIDSSQAGERIQCGCGQSLEIPSLRGLRELKPASSAAPRRASRAANDLPQRLVLVLGMLLMAIGLVVAAYGGLVTLQIRVPDRPTTDDPAADVAIDDLDATEAFRLWTELRDEGLGPYRAPFWFRAAWTKQYYNQFVLTGVALIGVGLLLGVGAFCLMPRRSAKPAASR